ncbi:hypothetical protein EJ110_NYTH54349 [Nymphaea thermarum]|nr:hypothetical protein EJ110_NYTH54349 [Nymphaea thermarum]
MHMSLNVVSIILKAGWISLSS